MPAAMSPVQEQGAAGCPQPVLLLAGTVPPWHRGSQGCANPLEHRPRAAPDPSGLTKHRFLWPFVHGIGMAAFVLFFPCSQGSSPPWKLPQPYLKTNRNPQAGPTLNQTRENPCFSLESQGVPAASALPTLDSCPTSLSPPPFHPTG